MVMLEYDFLKVDCNSAMWQNGKKNIKYNKTIEKKNKYKCENLYHNNAVIAIKFNP